MQRSVWLLIVSILVSLTVVSTVSANEANSNATIEFQNTPTSVNVSDLLLIQLNITNFNTTENLSNATIMLNFSSSYFTFSASNPTNASGAADQVNWTQYNLTNVTQTSLIYVNLTASNGTNNNTVANLTTYLYNSTGSLIDTAFQEITILNQTYVEFNVTFNDTFVDVDEKTQITMNTTSLAGSVVYDDLRIRVEYNASAFNLSEASQETLSNSSGVAIWNFSVTPGATDQIIVNFSALRTTNSEFNFYLQNSSGFNITNESAGVTIDNSSESSLNECFESYSSGDLFNFSILVEYFNGTVPEYVNGTITTQGGPTNRIYNGTVYNYSDASGSYRGCLFFRNVNITDMEIGDLDITAYTGSSQTDVAGVSPDFFGFPRDVFTNFLQGESNVYRTVYLSPATTLNITAFNRTNADLNFTYEVIRADTGEVIKSSYDDLGVGGGEEQYVFSQNVTVATTKDIFVTIHPTFAPPIKRRVNASDLAGNVSGRYALPVNGSFTFEEATGYVKFANGTIVQNATNLTVFSVDIWGNNIISFNGLMPQNLCAESVFPVSQICPRGVLRNDTTNETTGFFNITAPASYYGYNQLWLAFVAHGGNYYMGYTEQAVTIGSSLSFNITVDGMFGTQYDAVVGNSIEGLENAILGFNFSTLAKNISFYGTSTINNTTNATFRDYTVEVQSFKDGNEYIWMVTDYDNLIETASPSGVFYFPNDTDYAAARIFTRDYAPVEFALSRDNTGQSKKLETFDPQSFADNGSLEDTSLSITLKFYRNTSSCLNISPDESCDLLGGELIDSTQFNPLTLMSDEPVRMDMNVNGSPVKMLFYGVDLTQAGAPDAVINDEPLSEGTDELLWRFGSFAPPKYSYVYVAAPINTSTYNISQGINYSLGILYNEDYDVVWNVSANGTAESGGELPARYQDYWNASDGLYRRLFNGSGEPCTEITASNLSTVHGDLCYLITDANYSMFRLLHFSGIGATFDTDSVTSSSSSGGSGGGDGSSSGGGSGGGSSGGGSGGDSGTDYGERRVYTFTTTTDEVNTVLITGTDLIALSDISFVPLDSSDTSASIDVRRYDDAPTEVTALRESYQLMSIDFNGYDATQLEDIEISFGVPVTWFIDEGYDPDNMGLWRYVDDAWVDLPTTYNGAQGGEHLFTATTPGFSFFAIAPIVPNEEPQTEVEQGDVGGDEVVNSNEDVQEAPEHTIDEEAIDADVLGEKQGSNMVLFIILALIIIVAIYFVMKKFVMKDD